MACVPLQRKVEESLFAVDTSEQKLDKEDEFRRKAVTWCENQLAVCGQSWTKIDDIKHPKSRLQP
jgi:hypothetical protein